MNSEYVRLLPPEIIYAKKNLLKSRIEILNLTKSYETYKNLRKEELILKIAIKVKVEEAKNSLALLGSLLPKVKKFHETLPEKEENKKLSKKKLSLEQEIDSIKRKLAALQ